jgi:hypothetical protein
VEDIRGDKRDQVEQAGGSGNDIDLAVSEGPENPHGTGKHSIVRCSICRRRVWLNTTYYMEEPPGVPEPARNWTLCKRCYSALMSEMESSPVLSPLRLRIAIGIVAADRSPDAYAPTRQPFTDRTWIVVMAWGFGIAMVLHLILIVMLAFVAGH